MYHISPLPPQAQQAMTALVGTKEISAEDAAFASIVVSKEDVALIVAELEVTEEAATRALREVSDKVAAGQPVVVAALQRLVST